MWDQKTLDKIYAEIIPSFRDEVYKLNDYMADNPETGSHEFESSKRIVELLRSHRIDVEYPFSGIATAFKGTINPGAKHRAVFFAEYDALKGIGHACGHCASGCASLMAILSLNEIKGCLGDIGIDIIGTPDEEIIGCKCVMVKDGVFDNYDFAAMVHMGPVNLADVKFIALDGTIIKFFGVPAHAAQAPEQGRNALNAARLFFDAIDMMRQHIIQEARLHGYIVNGGMAANIVPEYSEIEFLSRAPLRRDLAKITDWVYDCVKAAALATHTKYEISPCGYPFDDLYTSPVASKIMTECFNELGMAVSDDDQSCGSTDMGNVSQVCPVFHPIMSIGQNFQLHTREFGAAMKNPLTHQAIDNAAKFLLKLTFKVYGNTETLRALKKSDKRDRTKN